MTDQSNDPIKLNCPTCQKVILWSDEFPFRPFCSDRCRLIDLGEWASESHRIPGKPVGINLDHDDDQQ